MAHPVHYIPVITTLVSVGFSWVLFNHWRRKPGAYYLLWWFIGGVMYGVGTFTESYTSIFGWNESIFRAWYISGALLGGAPLAQGTVYLLLRDKVAHGLTALLIATVLVASYFVLQTPINTALVEMHRLSGAVMEWSWVRLFSPFINIYALIFLAGGAGWSAWKYYTLGREYRARFFGNLSICVGAILPGIGGAYTRFGMVEVLYVTELIGISLIWLGYKIIVDDAESRSIHRNQIQLEAT
jgi:hypothetical protein